jgi:hypothetical protein
MLKAGLWPFESEKGRVRSSPVRSKRGDRSAHPTDVDDTSVGPVRATVFQKPLPACPAAACGRNPKRTIEIVSGTALWYSTGLPAVPLRWVLIRDPQQEFETQALLCTDLAAEPEQIISWFVRRLSDGEHIPGGPPAPWLRDPAAVVGKGAPENCSSAVGAILAGDATGSPAYGGGRADRPKSSLVGQGSPDILRRTGVGEKAVVGAGGDFLQVIAGKRPCKSPTRVHGSANRCDLLRSVNGQSPA